MSDKTRIRVAAGVTALFLAAISAVGLVTHRNGPVAVGAPRPAASTIQRSTVAPAPVARVPPATEHDGYEHEGADEYADDE
jgi:hypothetical protein